MTTIGQGLKSLPSMKSTSCKRFIDDKAFKQTEMELLKDTYCSIRSAKYLQAKQNIENVVDSLSKPAGFIKTIMLKSSKNSLTAKKDKIASKLNKGFEETLNAPGGVTSLKKIYNKRFHEITNEKTSALIKQELDAGAKKALAKKPTVHTLQETKRKAVVAKFERMAKEKYGVNAKYSSKDPLKAFLVNKALEKIHKTGFDLNGLNIKISTSADNTILETGASKSARLGATLNYAPNVYLRKNTKNGLNWGGYKLLNYGQSSTLNPEHTPIHEIGHFLNFKALKKAPDIQTKYEFSDFNDKTQKAIGSKVSKYAASNPSEAVAEIFAGVMQGKSFDKRTMDLYRTFKGPTSEKFEGLIKENAANAKSASAFRRYAYDDIVVAQKPVRRISEIKTTLDDFSKKTKNTDDMDKIKNLAGLKLKRIFSPFDTGIALTVSDSPIPEIINLDKKLR